MSHEGAELPLTSEVRTMRESLKPTESPPRGHPETVEALSDLLGSHHIPGVGTGELFHHLAKATGARVQLKESPRVPTIALERGILRARGTGHPIAETLSIAEWRP